MGLFLYDSELHEQVAADKLKVFNSCRELIPVGINERNFRWAVRTLTHHGVLVVPTDVAMLTPCVQRLQNIAHIMGIRVVPLASYITTNARASTMQARAEQATAPVAASAVPPTQHHAAAGQPIHP